MGQKTHPYGFRLGIVKPWRSRWYAGADFPELLKEDELIRKYLRSRLAHAAIADVHIERKPGKVTVTIFTGRPGVVIAHSPNRGLDVRASAAVHGHLKNARDQGAAVILLSEDLDEIMLLSDRIGVMNSGAIVAEFEAPADRHAIGKAMVGHD